ncbi:MAG TPA: glycosyltransferase family 1 protein [Acidimicrobiales bacterium]|nr:glycosyltransferase family 1 protein [Acidimicrobiales bacterium]
MRALIDATALGSERGGDETMLRGFIRGLALSASVDDRFTILADPSVDPLERVATSQPFRVESMRQRSGPLHFGIDLPRHLAARRDRFDVVFSVTHAPLRSPVPVALMVQDLSFLHLPDTYPFATRQRLQRIVGHQARRAAGVLTVSEFCRRDLIDSYGLDPLRVHVVPNAVEVPRPLTPDRRERALASLERGGVDSPFLLYLGNLHPRKNVARALQGFAAARVDPALADHQFVVAGARWWGSGEHEAAELSPPGRVVFLGRVDEDVRQLLLELADALVYVSRFEGFGLPPLEAMALSTPVLAGDAGAMPEVTGGAALLADPDDLASITDGIRRIVTDADLRAELVERGHARVANYDLGSTGAAARAALGDAAALAPVPR